jgi:O-antigen/teichoic acid export membrane protein
VTIIKLWATKISLRELGVEDFGLYNLLAGIVTMLAFFKVAMANSSQRFISVSLGRNDNSTKNIFYTSFLMHLLVGFLVVLCILVGGNLIVHFVLNIPEGKNVVAHIIVCLLSFSTLLTVISVPYDSIMISKENIPVLSLFVVLDALLILVAAYSIGFYSGNRLIFYSMVIVVGSLILFGGRIMVGRYLYEETRFSFHKIENLTLLFSLLKYAGWNVVSSFLVIVRNQGFAILFNLAGGVAVNAAYGIANQVNSLFNYCSEALMQPNRPLIMKAYGAGENEKSIAIGLFVTKIILLISAFVFVNLFVNMEFILAIWLGSVPQHAAYFCRVILCASFFVQMSQGAKTLVESTGNVKELFAHIGYFHLISLVVGVGIFWATDSILFSFLPMMLEEFVGSLYRIYLAKKYNGTRFFSIMNNCCLKPILIVGVIILLLSECKCHLSHPYDCLFSFIFSMAVISLTFYYFIFNESDRKKIKNTAKHALKIGCL